MLIRSRARREDTEADTNPNTETNTVATLQSANLCEIQCSLVPDLGIDSNFNFVGLQRIGVILMEFDSAIGEWSMGVEEKSAIGKRELKGGFRSVLWTTRTTTWPVWVAGFVGMMRLVGVIRFVRMLRLMGVVGLVRVVWLMGVTRLVGMTWFVGMIGLMGMVWFVGMIGFVGMVRVVGMLGTTGPTVAVMMSLARMFNLLWLRPLCVLVAFQLFIGIETGLNPYQSLMFAGWKQCAYP